MLACHNQGDISKVKTVVSTCYCDQRFGFNMRSFLSFYFFHYCVRWSRYSPWGGSRTRYRWCPNSIYDFCQISAIPSFCLLDIAATETFSETQNTPAPPWSSVWRQFFLSSCTWSEYSDFLTFSGGIKSSYRRFMANWYGTWAPARGYKFFLFCKRT
jgi:hypothetical protein